MARVTMGQSPPSEAYGSPDEELPFLQGNAEFGALHPNPRHGCDVAPKRCAANDLLLSVRAPVGAVNVADRPYGIGRGLCAITAGDQLDPRFLWHMASLISRQLNAHATGSTYDQVSAEDVRETKVLVPGLEEQRRIAGFLDDEVGRLGSLQGLRRRIALLARERTESAILRQVLPGSVDWSAEQALDDLPIRPIEGWAPIRLRFTVDGVDAGVWGDEPTGGPDDVGCVRVADFDYPRGGVSSVPTIRSAPGALQQHKELQSGDLLLEKSGGGEKQPVGRVVLWDLMLDRPIVCSNFIARMRPRPQFDGGYLQLLHRALYFAGVTSLSVKQTTGIQNLSLEHYLGRTVPVPELSQQIRIRDELRELIQAEQEIARQSARYADLVDEHRKAVVAAAVTGELDPASYRSSAAVA